MASSLPAVSTVTGLHESSNESPAIEILSCGIGLELGTDNFITMEGCGGVNKNCFGNTSLGFS